MEESDRVADLRTVACECCKKAAGWHKQGEFLRAIGVYHQSIELYPSPQAYTLLGLSYAHLGRYQEAIRSCLKATEIDPDLGNPYNDIGAYLIEMGFAEDAICWLERATRAKRYASYEYPWYNLGRVHEWAGRTRLAKQCYIRALCACRGFEPACKALLRLCASAN